MNKSILKKLREGKGFSQDELANLLETTRQTLAKIETGENELSSSQIKTASQIFDLPFEAFIENKLPQEPVINIIPLKIKLNKKQKEIRIDIPQENVNKFKEVFLYILSKVGGDPKVGLTYLYKILYFIDFDFYEKYEDQLMGLKYQKNTHGPSPVEFSKIIKGMIQNKEIQEIQDMFFDKPQKKFLAIKEANLSHLTGREVKHIDNTLERLLSRFETASQISNYSHEDIPWVTTPNKEIIPYESVFYRTDKTSVRNYEE